MSSCTVQCQGLNQVYFKIQRNHTAQNCLSFTFLAAERQWITAQTIVHSKWFRKANCTAARLMQNKNVLYWMDIFRSLFPLATAHRAAQGCISKRASTITAGVLQVRNGKHPIWFTVFWQCWDTGWQTGPPWLLLEWCIHGLALPSAGCGPKWLKMGIIWGNFASFPVLLFSLSFPLYDT